MKHSNITVSSGKLQFAELIKAHFYTPFGVPCEHPLPLPLGEVAEHCEDGEGKRSQFLTTLGLEILRFSNWDIDRDFSGVCTQIDLIIRKRLQDPLSHLR